MLKQALDYFKNDHAYEHLFTLFRRKYESLGRIGGTVKLDGFNEQELGAIARFFGTTTTELKHKGKISFEQFEKQLQRTKFTDLSLKQLLEAYFNEPLIPRRERQQQKEQQQTQLFNQLEQDFPALQSWICRIREKTRDTYWIYRLIEKEPANFIAMLEQLEQAINQLPSDYERLPMFSQRISGNPHAFDLNTNLGKLFIHALTVNHQKNEPIVVPADSEGINELLLHYYILRDDITNYVTCTNLLAETENGLHPMWGSAALMNSVLNVPLRELAILMRVYPAQKEKQVWIVENSGVYSSLIDQLPHIPLICTHGQFKLAALVLIDLLVKEGCVLYYSSDLDPEGINMAERLIQRHPKNIYPWKMDTAAYQKSISNVELSEERLKKLNTVTSSMLTPVVAEIRKAKIAGYQEALVAEMIEELTGGYKR